MTLTGYTEECSGATCNPHPSLAECTFDSLDFPQMIEKLQVFDHGLGVQHGVDWGINLVLQGEHVPANLSMRILQHTGIEASQDIGGIILGAR